MLKRFSYNLGSNNLSNWSFDSNYILYTTLTRSSAQLAIQPAAPSALQQWLRARQPRLVTDAHWQRIDAHERAVGEAQHRPRVKVANVEKLLGIAHG